MQNARGMGLIWRSHFVLSAVVLVYHPSLGDCSTHGASHFALMENLTPSLERTRTNRSVSNGIVSPRRLVRAAHADR
jgi:hypothetical protein